MAAKQIRERVNGVVTTANATVTALITYATTTGETGTVQILVVARDGAGNRACFSMMVGYKNVAGTLTVGTAVSIGTDKDAALTTTALTVAASGTNFVASVAGVAATTIDWYGEADIIRC
jgi:hypothetical protein